MRSVNEQRSSIRSEIEREQNHLVFASIVSSSKE